ncbi:hypothetical protein DB30_03671 [Enhygromyxa salina]|uniref:Tetratricopeptide repeat protein n=1 Tax=Enhygromyxa salina TaxID=215803 RepID=A0A0C1ZHJ5_9BACT|nr:hypothetical protein [Enhygromyxa salina]KIG17074.1 hypothetical protein DB30_03671 [Enhygromyxa salina]
MSEFADPRTVRSITAARKACARAAGAWTSDDDDDSDDPAAEAEQLARDAVEHLEQGRWDEACECAEATATLAEDHDQGPVWREFVLLVEEAAETGRDSHS